MSNPIAHLTSLGQSLWLDNIQRHLLENGEIAAMIDRGDIRGMTSNPSIFNNAIAKSRDYDSALLPLAWSGWGAEQIFWQLAFEDIRKAADLFLPLYHQTQGADGYVSLEVNPTLACDTAATIAQARHLWETVNRPNVMIKIPATKEGLPAIRQSIAAGINVNITLIFSIERYKEVMEAYLAGLDDRLQAGLPVEQIASVASFFVSRVDTKVDGRLPEGSPLRGKAAIANSKLAYEEFTRLFSGERFTRLQAAGCRIQRPLWASTSTKNPAYPDTLYVDELVGPETVNTLPQHTLEAFKDHGKARQSVTVDLDAAHKVITDLDAIGISMQQVTRELEEEGVETFAEAFSSLLQSIEGRRTAAVAQLGPLAGSVARRIARLEADAVPDRLQEGDPTLWTNDPKGQEEIRHRMGWLRLPIHEDTRRAARQAVEFAVRVRKDGFTHALLLGMGGSSLASEVLGLVFPPVPSSLRFGTLDSTDPAQVLATDRTFPPEKTLYIVSSKSGGTAEVNALFDYFWDRAGKDGSHFVAITDPGTSLAALANARGFRKTFLSDSTVGGRFSVLTYFGLVPAALLGIDLDRLLARAEWMARQCTREMPAVRNPGLVLGALLGQAALDGREKLTLIADPTIAPYGSWLEQLVAESSGKQGKGILPVDGEMVGEAGAYGDDRMFVYLRQDGQFDVAVQALQQAGHPAVVLDLADPYDLGAEFYRWEIATAVACSILRVNAFDQPDVQDSKDRTKAKCIAYSQSGKLDEGKAAWVKRGIKIFTSHPVSGTDLVEVVRSFLGSAHAHDYVAINAYLPRNPEIIAALAHLRQDIHLMTRSAITLGFGPRFLHSTGQLHKGGPDKGVFFQITVEPSKDIEIPGEGMTFGILERAQALGDYEALAARGRRILRLHFPSQVGLKRFIDDGI